MISPEDEKKLAELADRYRANEYDREAIEGITQLLVQDADNEELVHYLIDLMGVEKTKMILALNAPRLLRLEALQKKR